MPSLGDSAVIILLGLLLFGPKGLAQIARQLGKLMGEFRRASNEFRMQMEEELRLSEQADRQKEIAKIEAAAPPPAPVLGTDSATPESGTTTYDSTEDNPQLRSIASDSPEAASLEATPEPPIGEVEPLPIAVSGDLKIMPPATGLPQPRTTTLASSSIAPLVDSIPHEVSAEPAEAAEHEHSEQRPNRYTNGHTDTGGLTSSEPAAQSEAQESLHG
jgi:sec-independent protein translocase protein TatB